MVQSAAHNCVDVKSPMHNPKPRKSDDVKSRLRFVQFWFHARIWIDFVDFDRRRNSRATRRDRQHRQSIFNTILTLPSVNKLQDQQPWAKAKVRERPSASHSPPMLPSPHVPEIAARARASCFPRLHGSTQLGANLLCRPGQKRARGPDRSPTPVYAPLYAGQMAKFDLASALTRKECVPSACARAA